MFKSVVLMEAAIDVRDSKGFAETHMRCLVSFMGGSFLDNLCLAKKCDAKELQHHN